MELKILGPGLRKEIQTGGSSRQGGQLGVQAFLFLVWSVRKNCLSNPWSVKYGERSDL